MVVAWIKIPATSVVKLNDSSEIDENMENNNIKKIIKKNYGKIAQQNTSCCGSNSCCVKSDSDNLSKKIGYLDDQLTNVPDGSNLGLGCGNPLAIASLKTGQVVLDLGSGAGFDTFLASHKVGNTGKVIGVDITDKMVKKARENARKGNYRNVEFEKGDIEKLPVDDNSINTIISNCVINLAPNKKKVFKEAYRVLNPNGRMIISDIVLTKPLSEKMKKSEELLTGCIGGAIIKQEYFSLLKKVGFTGTKIHKEVSFLKNYAISITFSAYK